MTGMKPFEVQWRPAAIGEVLERVRGYPWPPIPDVADGWAYGCDARFLKRLCEHWLDGYDWRAAVRDLNRYPQFTARIEDIDIHFVHVVGEAEGRRPLMLIHGWPGSHYEFWESIEKLAWPSRHGGDAADAFDLVIPSLPGFGFSSKPARPLGQQPTARMFNTLMTEVLGYGRYRAQGGDWGAVVTSFLGLNHREHLDGIHVNMTGLRPFGPTQTPEEADWLRRRRKAREAMGAYNYLQASKPQSIAWLGAGNPVGQAAWIVERFYDWSDRREKPFEAVFSLDQLLTNVMLYVMTDSFGTGAWYYRAREEENAMNLNEGERCETPTAFGNYAGEGIAAPPPRSWAERAYNIVRWQDHPHGGHFAAMEEPDVFVQDLRAWGRGEG
jgi:microsomal epoxide hydrolase